MFFFSHPPVFVELKSPSEAQTNRLITSTHTPTTTTLPNSYNLRGALKAAFSRADCRQAERPHRQDTAEDGDGAAAVEGWTPPGPPAPPGPAAPPAPAVPTAPLQTTVSTAASRRQKRGVWIKSVAWRTLFDIPKDMIVKSSRVPTSTPLPTPTQPRSASC